MILRDKIKDLITLFQYERQTKDELTDLILSEVGKALPKRKVSKDIPIKERGKRLAYKQGYNQAHSDILSVLKGKG